MIQKGDYIPSGNWTFLSAWKGMLVGLGLVCIMAYIHAYVIVWASMPFFSGFIVILVIVALSFIPGYYTIHLGKIRSPQLAKKLGRLFVVIYLYVHWAFWIDLMIQSNGMMVNAEEAAKYVATYTPTFIPHILWHPIDLFQLIIHSGKWLDYNIGIDAMPAIMRFLWLLEALILIYVTPYNFENHTKKPFCEETNSWFKTYYLESFTGVGNKVQFKENLLEGDFSQLKSMTFKPRDSSHLGHSDIREYYHFEVMYSENVYYLNIKVRISKRPIGEVRTSELDIITNLKLPKEIGSKLLTIQYGQGPKDVFYPEKIQTNPIGF